MLICCTSLDNSSPADKLAEELSKEFGVKARAFKMSGGSSRAIDEAVKKITEEMGEVRMCY